MMKIINQKLAPAPEKSPTVNVLNQLIALDKEAVEFGFAYPNYDMILDQIISECHEVKESLSTHEPRERVLEEVSDLVHAVIELHNFLNADVEETLDIAVQKYDRRMKALRTITKKRGLTTLNGQSIEFIHTLWGEAKRAHASE